MFAVVLATPLHFHFIVDTSKAPQWVWYFRYNDSRYVLIESFNIVIYHLWIYISLLRVSIFFCKKLTTPMFIFLFCDPLIFCCCYKYFFAPVTLNTASDSGFTSQNWPMSYDRWFFCIDRSFCFTLHSFSFIYQSVLVLHF